MPTPRCGWPDVSPNQRMRLVRLSLRFFGFLLTTPGRGGGGGRDCSSSRGIASFFLPHEPKLNCEGTGALYLPSPRSPCSCPSEEGGTTIACRRQELQLHTAGFASYSLGSWSSRGTSLAKVLPKASKAQLALNSPSKTPASRPPMQCSPKPPKKKRGLQKAGRVRIVSQTSLT